MYSVEKTRLSATVRLPNGVCLYYNIKGGDVFEGAEGIPYTLETYGGGYLLTDLAKTEYFFDNDGYITAIEDVNGNRTEITRNGAQIIAVTNNSGTLSFTYSGGRISQITDHTNRSVYYTYEETFA